MLDFKAPPVVRSHQEVEVFLTLFGVETHAELHSLFPTQSEVSGNIIHSSL